MHVGLLELTSLRVEIPEEVRLPTFGSPLTPEAEFTPGVILVVTV